MKPSASSNKGVILECEFLSQQVTHSSAALRSPTVKWGGRLLLCSSAGLCNETTRLPCVSGLETILCQTKAQRLKCDNIPDPIWGNTVSKSTRPNFSADWLKQVRAARWMSLCVISFYFHTWSHSLAYINMDKHIQRNTTCSVAMAASQALSLTILWIMLLHYRNPA